MNVLMDERPIADAAPRPTEEKAPIAPRARSRVRCDPLRTVDAVGVLAGSTTSLWRCKGGVFFSAHGHGRGARSFPMITADARVRRSAALTSEW